MKRKVAKIGPTTLMVSLPSKWCRAHNIKQGNEIEVAEGDDTLVLSYKPITLEIKKTELNLSDAKSFPRQLMAALYKAGIDEAIVHYSTPQEKAEVHKVLSYTLLGYAIMEEKKDSLFIKDIAKIQKEEFNPLLKKYLSTASEIPSVTLEILKQPSEDKFNELISLRATSHKYSDACRRIINKFGLENRVRETTLFYLITEAEQFTRNCENLVTFFLNQKQHAEKTDIAFLEKINSLFTAFTGILMAGSIKDVDNFHTQVLKLEEELIKRIKTTKKNSPLLFYLGQLWLPLRNMRSPLLLIKV